MLRLYQEDHIRFQNGNYYSILSIGDKMISVYIDSNFRATFHDYVISKVDEHGVCYMEFSDSFNTYFLGAIEITRANGRTETIPSVRGFFENLRNPTNSQPQNPRDIETED